MSRKITFKGNPLTLEGSEPAVGAKAPAATLLKNDLSSVSLTEFKGRTLVISCVPSLDTPVCDIQTRAFNSKAAQMPKETVVLAVSMDLPFAQSRWCGAAGAKNVMALSDHMEASFGKAFGILIKELRLLARAVFIVDGEGILRYKQIVGEITNEPDYEDVLQALKNIVKQ